MKVNKFYWLAYMKTDGSWDNFDTFHAADDDAANEYASANYTGEWYVLDANRNNING